MNQKSTVLQRVCALLLGLYVVSAHAGVIVGGTRLVYDGNKRESAISVKNPDKTPYLIQSWVDSDGADGKQKGGAKPPFVVTPPLFRLDAGNENQIRIIRAGGALPEDRESVFWLNVKSIPATPSSASATNANLLQISVKSRIKLFYRPDSLKNKHEDELYPQVTFQRQGNSLQVTNASPYYLTFYSLKVGAASVDTSNIMLPPKGSAHYTLPAGGTGGQVSWQLINDYGGYSKPQTSMVN